MTSYFATFFREYTASYRGLPKSCWQGISLTCVNAFTIGICFFLSLYFVDIKHFSVSLSGLLISCYGFGTVSGGLLAGKLSDNISPRLISIVSLFGQSAAFYCLIQLQSPILMMLNLCVLGIASYGFKISNNAWIFNLCGNDTNLRFKTMSISHVACNLGLGLSGLFTAGIVTYGFHSILILSSTLLLCSALYLLFQSSTYQAFQVLTKEQSNTINKKTAKVVYFVLASVFLIGLIIAQLGSTYPLYIQETFPQLGIQAVSILFILDTFLIVLCQAPLTALVSKYNKFVITGIGALLMGLGMFILSFSSNFTQAIISCIVWTTGEMLFVSTAQLICYENSNNNKKGQSLGLFQTAFALSNVIGPGLGSVVYQYWGGNLLWYCSMFIGVMCFGLCLYFSRMNADAAS